MILGTCLSVAGYSNKFPRAVVHGPTLFGGVDRDSIYAVNLYEKLKLLIGSVQLQDKLGAMILVQLTWLQIFAGISTPLLQSEIFIDYIPLGWIKNLHKLLVEERIQVEIATGWVPTLQRENDRVLMDLAHKIALRWAWEGINLCRLFLHATTLTNIVTADGKFIPEKIL